MTEEGDMEKLKLLCGDVYRQSIRTLDIASHLFRKLYDTKSEQEERAWECTIGYTNNLSIVAGIVEDIRTNLSRTNSYLNLVKKNIDLKESNKK